MYKAIRASILKEILLRDTASFAMLAPVVGMRIHAHMRRLATGAV